MNDNKKKLSFAGLTIEITRKCNLSCKHCMRGDAQDLTISPEIIDIVLSQIAEIHDLLLTGGEPLLELDTVEYLLHAINRQGVNVDKLQIVTNGTILNERVADIFLNFAEKNPHCEVMFGISDDIFHDKAQSKECFDFYSSRFSEKIPVAMHGELPLLRSCGRVQMVKEIDGIPVKGLSENSFRPHRICIEDNLVCCEISLLANGNIALDGDVSYEIADKVSFGNVKCMALKDIFEHHNKTCVCLCDECYCEVVAHDALHFLSPPAGKYTKWIESKYLANFLRRRIELVWEIRRWALKNLPTKDVRQIIQATNIDNEMFADAIQYVVINVYRYDPKISEEIRSITFLNDIRSKYRKFFKKKFPFASLEELSELSVVRSFSEIANLMNFNDLLFGLFNGNPPLAYFDDIEDRLEQHGVTLDDWNECTLVPNTLDPRGKEQMNNDDDQANELQPNAAG